VFTDLRARGLGPALRDAADRYVALVDAVYRTPPTTGAIDYYVAAGLERAERVPVVAAEYLDEARQVEALAAEPHRRDEIAWQLARAYAAAGDAAHARPLLDAIVQSRSPHADEAAALRAQLAP